MTVEVKRHDVNEQPDSGRPLVAQFIDEKGRRLDVRVQRDDGSLWLWAMGPANGDRGKVVLGLRRAADAIEFANSIRETDSRYGSGPSLGAGEFALRVRRPWKDRAVDEETTDRLVSVVKGMSMHAFSLRFDEAALDELAVLLREWGTTGIAAGEPAPRAGEFFARGELPRGTVEQVRAWVQAGPKGRLCQIRDDSEGGLVIFCDVLRLGGLGSAHSVPLADFYGDGWRRLG